MDKKYSIRHEILQTLMDHSRTVEIEPYQTMNDLNCSLSDEEIAHRLGRDTIEVESQLNYLFHHNYVKCFSDEPDIRRTFLTALGTEALAEETFLSVGKRELREIIGSKVKIGVALGGFVIAITTLLINLFNTSQNTQELERVNQKIDSISQILLTR